MSKYYFNQLPIWSEWTEFTPVRSPSEYANVKVTFPLPSSGETKTLTPVIVKLFVSEITTVSPTVKLPPFFAMSSAL